MKLIYHGTDITDMVNIVSAYACDNSGEKTDSVVVTLSDARRFLKWRPERNDTFRVERNGWDSGDMYLTAAVPEGDRLQLYGCAMKSAALAKKSALYERITLKELTELCAAESGMEAALYGVDGSLIYEHVVRRNESAAAFAQRLLTRQGAKLKCIYGKLAGIGIEWAQGQKSILTLNITEGNDGVTIENNWGWAWSGLKLIAPGISGVAYDTEQKDHDYRISADECPENDIEAARWARGMLICHNREAESLTIKSSYNPRMTAMMKVTVSGSDSHDGDWMIDRVTHELISGRTETKLVRTVNGIR